MAKMTNRKMIELVRDNHGGLDQATDAEILMIAKSLPAGTLEKYDQKGKVAKTDADS